MRVESRFSMHMLSPRLPQSETEPFEPFVGSIWNEDDRERASLLAKTGIIAASNKDVWGLWLNGALPEAPQLVVDVKGGGREKSPLATTFPSKDFLHLVDLDEIPEDSRQLFRDPDIFRQHLGGLCFVRVPVKEILVQREGIPKWLLSKNERGLPILQNYDADGNPPVAALIRSMLAKGIIPAVTSMNFHGADEISDDEEALTFARSPRTNQLVKAVLSDERAPKMGRRGSYTIIEIDRDGYRLIREGNTSSAVIEEILREPISRGNHTRSKTLQALELERYHFPPELLDDRFTSAQLRVASILLQQGMSVDEVTSRISQMDDIDTQLSSHNSSK